MFVNGQNLEMLTAVPVNITTKDRP
jgi:hypothetical protein